jgi:hypothetical protein
MALNGIAHKELTDPQLHDLKGVSAALAGQLPFANDSGASYWKFLTPDDIHISNPREVDEGSSSTTTAPSVLSVSGLSETVTGSCVDAGTFSEVNKNTKEVAVKLNEVIAYTAALQVKYNDLVAKFNALQDALDNLGFISVRS